MRRQIVTCDSCGTEVSDDRATMPPTTIRIDTWWGVRSVGGGPHPHLTPALRQQPETAGRQILAELCESCAGRVLATLGLEWTPRGASQGGAADG